MADSLVFPALKLAFVPVATVCSMVYYLLCYAPVLTGHVSSGFGKRRSTGPPRSRKEKPNAHPTREM